METIRAEEISEIISRQIKEYEKKLDISETGTVLSVGDGIARVYGVENAMAMELLEFPGGILGMVLNLEADNVGVAVLGEVTHIKEGDIVKRTGQDRPGPRRRRRSRPRHRRARARPSTARARSRRRNSAGSR